MWGEGPAIHTWVCRFTHTNILKNLYLYILIFLCSFLSPLLPSFPLSSLPFLYISTWVWHRVLETLLHTLVLVLWHGIILESWLVWSSLFRPCCPWICWFPSLCLSSTGWKECASRPSQSNFPPSFLFIFTRETEAAVAKCKDLLKVFGLREENSVNLCLFLSSCKIDCIVCIWDS